MNTEVNAQALLSLLNQRKLPVFKTLPEVCDFVTNFLINKYNLHQPSWINHGYCFIWAYLVWALWKKPLSFVSSDNHVVIYDEDSMLYYDASNNEGYESLEQAEVDPDDCADIGIKGMAWYWARCGTYNKEFRKILRATHRKLYQAVAKGGFGGPSDSEIYIDDIPYGRLV